MCRFDYKASVHYDHYLEATTGGVFLKNVESFTGKHPPDSLQQRLQHRCFPVKFEKFLRTPI